MLGCGYSNGCCISESKLHSYAGLLGLCMEMLVRGASASFSGFCWNCAMGMDQHELLMGFALEDTPQANEVPLCFE